MGSKLFRIGLGAGLAVFMGAVTIFGCALPRFANVENAVVNAESGTLSSSATENAKEIVPFESDEIVYTTSQGLAIKKQNATLYMTINGTQYEVVGQGGGRGPYVALEYLQSAGGQAIDTGYYSTVRTDRIVVDYQSTSTDQYGMFAGWSLNELNLGGTYEWWYVYKGGNACNVYVNNTKEQTSINFTNLNTSRHTAERNKGVYYHDGANKGTPTSLITGTAPTTFKLFGHVYTPKDSTAFNYYGKIFDAQIYDAAGKLVRDFIPAKRLADNVLGMYDRANNKFYTNVGSGSFTGGAETTTKLSPWSDVSEYVDSSPAANAIANDARYSNRLLAEVVRVGDCPAGYLVVKNGSNYLKVRI